MLTGSGDDDELALRALAAGCTGFVGKGQSITELVSSLRAAYVGEAIIAPSVLARLLPRVLRQAQGSEGRLSDRELEVLQSMATGATDKEIAAALFISLNTVRKHVQNVIRKLGTHSKLEAVVVAVRDGVIGPL
jgi:DNA-binding NarL/FixJ family response regulator